MEAVLVGKLHQLNYIYDIEFTVVISVSFIFFTRPLVLL
jgi:hypothetical protein